LSVLYRNPACTTPDDLRVTDELLARLNETVMDKALKRLQNEEGVRVFKTLMHVDPGHFVVVKAPGMTTTVTFSINFI
jgi:hypothetical protein